MIVSFKHKGLKKFYETGSTRGIIVEHQVRLRLILSRLDDAKVVDDIEFLGANLHPLKGDLKGHWSVKVNGNWRVTFTFNDGRAEIIDYQDYH